MPTIHLTKTFIDGLNKLRQAERRKVTEAIIDAQVRGSISLPRSRHGEDRIPNVEKYMVSDGDRLVVQVVDPNPKFPVRVFLFTGPHDDTEKWLKNHEDYKWVARNSDNRLDFVLLTDDSKANKRQASMLPEPNSSKDSMALPKKTTGPLLQAIEPQDWERVKLKPQTRTYLMKVDTDFFQANEADVMEKLVELEPGPKADLLYDLLILAQNGALEEVRQRLSVFVGDSRIIPVNEFSVLATEDSNVENLITFDDVDVLRDFAKKGGTLAEWMFFLHPSQKELVDREFKGPARLRGVSGSGKTCVLLHRARSLARKYKQQVLVVTLTESMRKLLETLLDDFCGVERALIETATVRSVINRIANASIGKGNVVNFASDADIEDSYTQAIRALQSHPNSSDAPYTKLSNIELRRFLKEELLYIRSRLVTADYATYLDTESFVRRGRGFALNRSFREPILDALFTFETRLSEKNVADNEMVVQFARGAVISPPNALDRYRCVFIDEVQDLSQMELEIIANLRTDAGDPIRVTVDGLFLVGDGTQTIYRKGFRLGAAGIQITGRSYLLKKNYRNTREILRAAYSLVSNYEFADGDETEIRRPIEPEYASRRGALPVLLKCKNTDDEAAYIVETIKELCGMSLTPGQICVIGCNQTVRDAVSDLLRESNVPWSELKLDVRGDSDNVKISTIESAKGHEFNSVFIAGLVDGVIPPRNSEPEELSREASRLYVAMTRARDDLYLTYSPTRDLPASRFLIHIAEHCNEASRAENSARAF